MYQNDFLLRTINGGDWTTVESNFQWFSDIPCPHWIPISVRARTIFTLSAINSKNYQLNKTVRAIFCTKALKLSLIDEQEAALLKFGSRVKDPAMLFNIIRSTESVIMWGDQRGFFSGMMYPNPTLIEYWSYLHSITFMDNEKDIIKFLNPFIVAFRKSFNDALSM